jgi:hypothetical protein
LAVGYYQGEVEVYDATTLQRVRRLQSEGNRAHTAMKLLAGPGDRVLLLLLVGEYLVLPLKAGIPSPDPLLQVYDLETGFKVRMRQGSKRLSY